MRAFTFEAYHATEEGEVPTEPTEVVEMVCTDEKAARNVARKLALKHQGPVDVARVGPTPWNDRYIGTACPTYPYTGSKAVTWERLD